ncbi:uncharacterized protein B0T15DRAFT_571747 [Chaetomium strumarium]|uniref:Uncharacterized protein n=1 Tax=Chaetomium strumarium TaxID=1170767 RepID=A0AAJ0H434_9PEZI|nr:hypothetical protein B0T15DRAFT_571747 [Chaetomium strumarium]
MSVYINMKHQTSKTYILGRLILAVRSPAKGEAAAKQLRQKVRDTQIDVWEVDMLSYASVQAFAEWCKTLSRINFCHPQRGGRRRSSTLPARRWHASGYIAMFSARQEKSITLKVLGAPSVGSSDNIRGTKSVFALSPSLGERQLLAFVVAQRYSTTIPTHHSPVLVDLKLQVVLE